MYHVTQLFSQEACSFNIVWGSDRIICVLVRETKSCVSVYVKKPGLNIFYLKYIRSRHNLDSCQFQVESQLSCLDIHLFCRVPMLLCAPLRFSLHLSLSLSLSASWPVYIYEALSLYHPSSFLLDVVSTVNCVGSPGHFSFSWEHSLT